MNTLTIICLEDKNMYSFDLQTGENVAVYAYEVW